MLHREKIHPLEVCKDANRGARVLTKRIFFPSYVEISEFFYIIMCWKYNSFLARVLVNSSYVCEARPENNTYKYLA